MQPLAFRAIAAITFADLLCELVRAVAIVALKCLKQTAGHTATTVEKDLP